MKKFETSSHFHKYKSQYKNNEDMNDNILSIDDPKNAKNLSRKKEENNSVKNIKDEVIVKRNEIIVKIEQCQNLLNTIMKEKNNYMTNTNTKSNTKRNNDDENLDSFNKINHNTYSYIKRFNTKNNFNTNKYKKIIDISNLDNIDNRENYNEPKINNNYKYKKINIKDNDKQYKYSFDYIEKDKADLMRENKKKVLDNNTSNNNHSFERQLKRVLYQKEDIPPMVGKKLIKLYEKYENESYSSNMTNYNNNNKNKLNNSQSLNNTFSHRDGKINIYKYKNKQVEDFTNNNYRNKNDEINNKIFKTRKIKGPKIKNQYLY